MPDNEGIGPPRPAEMELARPGDVVFARGSAVGLPRAAPAGWPPDIHPFDLIDANWHMAVRDSVYSWPGDVNANGKQLINAKFDAASKAAAQTPWGQNIDAAGYSLTNAKFDAASKAAAQTPWGQDIDGANFALRNVQRVNGGGYRATSAALFVSESGPGLELMYNSGSYGGVVQPIDRTTGAYKTLSLFGAPIVFSHSTGIGATEVMRTMSGGVEVAGDGRFGGYVESAVAKGFCANLYFDGTNWRYRANGPAALFHASGAAPWSAIYTASTGTADAIASITAALTFRDDGVTESGRQIHFPAANGFKLGLAGPAYGIGIETQTQYYVVPASRTHRWYQGTPDDGPSAAMELTATGVLRMRNANGERIRIYDSAGNTGPNHAIGVEPNCMWFQVSNNSGFRWYVGRVPDNGATSYLELNYYALYARTTLCVLGSNAFAINAHYTDQWRYTGPGNTPAWVMYSDGGMNAVRVMCQYAGVPGNPASMAEILQYRPDGITALVPLFVRSNGQRNLTLQSTGANIIDCIVTDGPAGKKNSRFMGGPGYIGMETLNDAYSAGITQFTLYTNICRTNAAFISALPSTANLDGDLLSGQFHAYLASNTQLVFRVRSYDGGVRQVVLNLT